MAYAVFEDGIIGGYPVGLAVVVLSYLRNVSVDSTSGWDISKTADIPTCEALHVCAMQVPILDGLLHFCDSRMCICGPCVLRYMHETAIVSIMRAIL
jgi:hypothetical protein